MGKKLAIIGIFYSGYQNIWHDFIYLYNKFWNSKLYNFYIVSDSDKDFLYDGVKVLGAGKDAEYSRKVQYALANIDADYILLLLEDFFFGSAVSDSSIDTMLKFITENDIKYYSMPMQDFSGNYKGKKISNRKNCRQLSHKADYTLSCQPVVWERQFLKDCIGLDNYNAWIFEGIYKKSKKAHTKAFLERCVVDLSNPLHLHHGLVQRKMLVDTIKYFDSIGYTFSFRYETMSSTADKKRKRIILASKILPYWAQKMVKRALHTKSITDKYDETIDHIIERMGL